MADMATAGTVNVRVRDVVKRATLNVRIVDAYGWKARMTIGLSLMRLAAWVMQCGIRVSDDLGLKEHLARIGADMDATIERLINRQLDVTGAELGELRGSLDKHNRASVPLEEWMGVKDSEGNG